MADLLHAVQIAAKPEAIYPLIATAEGFAQWWATDVTEGEGVVTLGFFKRNTIYRLRLKVTVSPVRADWTCETGDEWNGTGILFELARRESGTTLFFAHVGWNSETSYFRNCNTTWGELMYRLKSAAEGKPRGPLFLADELAY